MLYKTRNLIAQREIPLSDRLLKPGEAFTASHIDAEYYIGKGSAREADDKPAAPATPAARKVAPADPPAAEVQRKRARAAAEVPRATVANDGQHQETEGKKAPEEGDPTGSQQKPDAAG